MSTHLNRYWMQFRKCCCCFSWRFFFLLFSLFNSIDWKWEKYNKFNSTIWWMSSDWNERSRLLDYIMDLTVTMRENVRSDWRKYSIHLYRFSNRRDSRHVCVCVWIKPTLYASNGNGYYERNEATTKKPFQFNLTNVFGINFMLRRVKQICKMIGIVE